MTTSLLNVWRYSNASRATRMQASGSSPLTWKIGACTIRATSVEWSEERDEPGVGGAAVEHVLLGAGDALEHRVDRLEVRGVGGDRHLDLVAVAGHEGAL